MADDQRKAGQAGQGPTIKAVLAETKRLRDVAEQIVASDPWAKPYRPSDRLAYDLHAQFVGQLAEGEEPSLAAKRTMVELRRRAAEKMERYREQCERSDGSRKRLERRQRVTDAERRHRLSRMTVGQRLDEALASLLTVSEVRAASLEGQVSQSKPGTGNPLARKTENRAGGFQERALLLVAEIEDEIPRTRRRGGEAAA